MNMPNIKQPHIGRKVEKLRELRGMKQETLAAALGITQHAISRIENSETIDEEKLAMIAEALGISADAIKNFNEDATFNFIENNNNDFVGVNFGTFNSGGREKEDLMITLLNAYRELAETQKEHNRLLEQIVQKLKG
jgi:transcriptional regulator with XRE-family HTH domain